LLFWLGKFFVTHKGDDEHIWAIQPRLPLRAKRWKRFGCPGVHSNRRRRDL